MAMNNRERVGKALEYLSEGLIDLVDEVMTREKGAEWNEVWARELATRHGTSVREMSKNDVQTQLKAIVFHRQAFKNELSYAQQSYASELLDVRNAWAHHTAISSDDALRALDTTARLLEGAGAVDSANDVKKLHSDLLRTVYEDRTRQRVKPSRVALDPESGLKPWREVIEPHDDVMAGNFRAAEFAADLHQVRVGNITSPEYADPVEFFNRTYLTEGLRDLLFRALKRVSGDENASPVVNLQTNFGGGKTHSMLALYHLFSGTSPKHLPQEVQELIDESGVDLADLSVRRVALVGTHLKPAEVTVKDDGTRVHTLWGEMAWQLGGRKAYDFVAESDRLGVNPGDALSELFKKYGPAIILIDEWVAYARTLLTDKDLPAGTFDNQFTFAQALAENVIGVPGVMLVVSIPASDDQDGKGSDIEIGGDNGKKALDRLQNVIRRVADQWRPSSKDESFEIVRRRLFKAPDAAAIEAISATARRFVSLYQDSPAKFPSHAVSLDYEKRIKASYPLHPELLDRLYEDWSTLERFQRTRGVLKLVSSIVYALWASKDTSPLILPGNVPLEATEVNTDLTQYLDDQWKPIIDSDIDGPKSTAFRIDMERANLGNRFVVERLARTIFMGSAPRSRSERKGLDRQNVFLGTATPSDTLGNFGLALELLEQRSTYFYEEQAQYWFDTRPSVVKTAADYAEQLRNDPELVWEEIVRRLDGQPRNGFARVHVAPTSTGDIPDTDELRLVVVHPRHATHKQQREDSETKQWIKSAVELSGSAQRIHRNMLVFLVADSSELEGLEEAVRYFLGWKKVQDTSEVLNLSTQQMKQASMRVKQSNDVVETRLFDTFNWAFFPQQTDPTAPFTLVSERLSSSNSVSLSQKVWERLGRSDQIVEHLSPDVLGMTLHGELGLLWTEQKAITVGELWQYFTRYTYMPRLASRRVLDDSVQAINSFTVVTPETFAVATGKNDETGRYLDLIIPPVDRAPMRVTDKTILVDLQVAQAQQLEEQQANNEKPGPGSGPHPDPEPKPWPKPDPNPKPVVPPQQEAKARYYGSVRVDARLYGKKLNDISKEVIERLIGAGADVELTLDIQAVNGEGFTESVMTTISENSNALKFDSYGFEEA